MLTQPQFYALRLSQLSPDRAARAPEKARRAMVFSVGRKRLDAMDAVEQGRIYQKFLAGEVREIAEITDHWFDAPYHTAQEDGLSLWYAGERLVRLKAEVTTGTAPGPMAGLLSVLQKADPAREEAHLNSLTRFGWPLAAGTLWRDARPVLIAGFEEIVIQKPFNRCQCVRGVSQGLYYTVFFVQKRLSGVTIVDAGLVRENMLGCLDECIRNPDGDGMEDRYVAGKRAGRQEVAAADLSSLEGVMAFFHDLPEKATVEFANPPLTCFDKPAPKPADDRPEWMKTLSPEAQTEMRTLMFNSEMKIMGQLVEGMKRVKSFEEFRKLRDELQAKPENKELIAKRREELGELWGPERRTLSATGFETRVRRTVKEHFQLAKSTRLTGGETLRGDFHAIDDDLHLLRVALGGRLDISLRSEHLAEINTVAELVAKAWELYQSPDAAPREDCPASALDLLQRQTTESFACINQEIDAASARLKSRFEEEAATFVLKSGE